MLKRILKSTFSLLNVDYVYLDAKWNYRNVISPYNRLYYIDDGEGTITDQKANFKLEPGYLYLIPSFTLCDLECKSHLGQLFVQFFDESFDGISLFDNNRSIFKIEATDIDVSIFKRLLEINPGRGINRSDNPRIYEKNIFYKEYQELNNRQSTSAFLETQGILLQLSSRFVNQRQETNKSSEHIPVKILDAMSYIALNLSSDLSVAILAERANQHPDHFSRSFKLYTGDRPVKYVREKRIERAQYLLVTTQMTSEQIATETGFENVFYFSKVFKEITGMAPMQYKKQIALVNS